MSEPTAGRTVIVTSARPRNNVWIFVATGLQTVAIIALVVMVVSLQRSSKAAGAELRQQVKALTLQVSDLKAENQRLSKLLVANGINPASASPAATKAPSARPSTAATVAPRSTPKPLVTSRPTVRPTLKPSPTSTCLPVPLIKVCLPASG